MSFKISPADKHLVEEFRAKPLGSHSPALRRLLTAFRSGPNIDSYVLLAIKPHEEWVLAQLPEQRGQPLKIHPSYRFHSLEKAQWEIFKLRWKRHTGESLED